MALNPIPSTRTDEVDDCDKISRRQIHSYYPAEGYGCLYHRSMLNDFHAALIRRSKIQSVAEVPLDSYGVVGAGSLVFAGLRRKLTLVSDDKTLLERSSALMRFNGISDVTYLHTAPAHIPVASNSFDFSWSYERMQVVQDAGSVLDELCRVSKAIMVVVPNAYNYGQYPHYLYHRATSTTCDYVGPRPLTRRAEVRDALKHRGMTIIEEGLIDVPWWPLFPELPNLARRLLGRAPVVIDPSQRPEVNPQVIAPADVPELQRKIHGAAVIERSCWIPRLVKMLFAHSVYVIGCKPRFRNALGL